MCVCVCVCVYTRYCILTPETYPRWHGTVTEVRTLTLLCIASLCFCLSIYLTVLFFNDDDDASTVMKNSCGEEQGEGQE